MTTSANPAFRRIALTGRRSPEVAKTLVMLIEYLQTQHVEISVETSLADSLPPEITLPVVQADQLADHADLLIVIGGDGAFLRAAKIAIAQTLPILGINRGRLGFLTDINPQALEKIAPILKGDYHKEHRFLLQATTTHPEKGRLFDSDALNEVVLTPGDTGRMIEFETYINEQFVCTQRADGLIISTPTGSTAYALSGGGPILHPSLDAVALVPMFPHTLTSRPIVISSTNNIEIRLAQHIDTPPFVSCDGQQRQPIPPGASIHISKKEKTLQLVHPTDYNYYEALRIKLNWESKHYADPPSN